jgi:hypothetical protein
MLVSAKRFGLAAALAGVALFGALTPARAQPPLYTGRVPPVTPINRNFYVAPGLTLNQWAYNTAVMGRTLAQVPPYALGYNPYPQAVSYGPSFPTIAPNYMAGYGGGYVGPMLSTNGLGYGGYGSPYVTANPTTATLSTDYSSPGYGGSYPYTNPYYPPYYSDPFSGYLYGTADILRANGDYLKKIGDARLVNTQADMARLDYRRRIFDEARYERMNTPSLDELRQQQLARDLARARKDPPIGEIVSARALNDLNRHLADEQSKPNAPKGPNVPLDDDVLKHITVTAQGGKGGNIGVLRDDGKVQWPLALQGAEFDAARKRLSQSLEHVVSLLKSSNRVETGELKDIKKDLAKLNDMVRDPKSDLSPTDYIEARKFIGQLEDAMLALEDPNAANYFNPSKDGWKASGKDVASLIDDMKSKGLEFAPASPGDEWAYRVLHQAMVAYDYGLQQASARQQP